MPLASIVPPAAQELIPAALSMVTLFGMFIIAPWLITRIWQTTQLGGDLGRRLLGVAHEYHVGFRRVLIWRTHHLGAMPPSWAISLGRVIF